MAPSQSRDILQIQAVSVFQVAQKCLNQTNVEKWKKNSYHVNYGTET